MYRNYKIYFCPKIVQKYICIVPYVLNLFCYNLQFWIRINTSKYLCDYTTVNECRVLWVKIVMKYYGLQDIVWHKAEWEVEQWTVCFIHVADKPETAGYRSSTSSYAWNGSSKFSNETTSWWCYSKYNSFLFFI